MQSFEPRYNEFWVQYAKTYGRSAPAPDTTWEHEELEDIPMSEWLRLPERERSAIVDQYCTRPRRPMSE